MKKYIISAVFVFLGVFGLVSFVSANPLFVALGIKSATATSSQTAIAGGATNSSWLVFDAYSNNSTIIPDRATLLLQATAASSTASVLNLTFEYSNDSIDWYGDLVNAHLASTTQALDAKAVRTYTWTLGTLATSSRAINFTPSSRYTRVIASSTTATTSIWGEIVPIKQKSE